MEDKIKVFLASGKLEAYIYGNLDPKDQEETMHYINKYPVVKKEYLELQEQLEKISRQQAIKAPIGMKSQIMQSLPDKPPQLVSNGILWAKYIAIAGLAASLILAWGWYNTNSQLQKEKENYELLASECEQREKQIESQKQRIAFLNAEQTERLEMQGNTLAPNYKVKVFINEALEKIILTPINDVKLPENKCLQLWGDLDGEMIPIAVLSVQESKEYELKINPSFTSLNITIEEKTDDGKGQDHPDVSQLIASVLI